jgi:NAD(P)-dependent dehydrogenase (short-subunit alcohol dehydrogenase family)
VTAYAILAGNMRRRPTGFFENKVSVVIGGGSGIGAAVCRLLVEDGARVVVADRDFDRAKNLTVELGGCARACEVDITCEESVQAFIQDTVAAEGGIDLLVNSAGVLARGDARDFTNSDWSSVLNINLNGAITATMAAYRVMAGQGFGHIVNVASLSGLNAPPFFLPYVTSKYAVVGFSLALRAEAKSHGVNVSVVCPGNVDTPMISALSQQLSRATPAISPARAAEEILRGIRLNKQMIVFPGYARLFWFLERNAPWLSSALRDLSVAKGSGHTKFITKQAVSHSYSAKV